MNLYSVAIGEKYELEAKRLQESMQPLGVRVFTNADLPVVNDDPLINGLYHKSNFANYIDKADGAVVFMDADMFTFHDNPFNKFKVKKKTEIAYVPYESKWHLPDTIRQETFDFHGHKINSGFIYFRNLDVAKEVCTQWSYEYLEREKLYDVSKGTSKYEYDEWALMIALMKLKPKVELLDKKWNHWTLSSKEEMLESGSVLFQSHNLEIE